MHDVSTAQTASIPAFIQAVGASIVTITMLLALSATFDPAAAQIACTTRSEVAEQLAGDYAEEPVAVGLASSGAVIEVFTNGDGSTWTIVLTRPEGTSCPVATGEAWMTLPIKIKGPGV
jgi:hypothetical protein